MSILKALTPEQQKEVNKAFSKAQTSFLWIGTKLITCLFGANLACIVIGKTIFMDSDPSVLLGFRIVCFITNTIIFTRYFTSQMNEINDSLSIKIKEILKDKVPE